MMLAYWQRRLFWASRWFFWIM